VKGVLLRMALGALTTLLLLGLVELSLTLVGLPADGLLYDGDPAYYWTVKPDLRLAEVAFPEEGTTFPVRTSSEGLRDDPIPEDGPWILALGCSTTFGWGVAQEENWTELLEAALGVPVVNAGQPGHSTQQGLTFAAPLLDRKPTVALMGWIVRDAQLAPAPDIEARPSPWMVRTRMFRSLKGLLSGPSRPAGEGVYRVGPEAYRANLAQLITHAEDAESKVVLHAFPEVTPSRSHRAILDQMGRPVVAPELPRAAFFENDPVHLNALGHDALARILEDELRRALLK